jgi:hypothetical protein
MKKPFITLAILFAFYTFLHSQTVLIDHNCTDVSLIPSAEIDAVQDNIKWHYAHTSHGQQLVCGLISLESNQPEYAFEIDTSHLPVAPGELCIYDGQESGLAYVNPQHYWSTSTGIQNTHNVLDHNPTINVSGFMWCVELETYSASQVQDYFTAMASLEADYPNVTFVYFTGNAQADGSLGYNRHLRNEEIRQYCAANDKVLYDFADIDCWYNGEMNYYIYSGDTIPIEHTAYNGNYWTECGHANATSREMKANAAWWLLARLNGWSENGIEIDIKAFLEGAYNGTDMDIYLNELDLIPLSQPFNVAPWNYAGTEVVTSMPSDDIVDWVLIELRDATDAATADDASIVGHEAAFILRDGSVRNIDGISNLQFDNLSVQQSLFVVVYHRNHLGIMSANPLNITDWVYSYDFTDSEVKTYGNPSGIKELKSGIWGMAGGDFDGNGSIDLDDKTNGWNMQAGSDGYIKADFNLNGLVNNVDKNDIWESNLNAECVIPE